MSGQGALSRKRVGVKKLGLVERTRLKRLEEYEMINELMSHVYQCSTYPVIIPGIWYADGRQPRPSDFVSLGGRDCSLL
jgi:hypothetical protein